MVSHRRTSQPGLAARTTRVTVLSAAAASAALSGAAALPAAADPSGGPQDTAARLDRLYQQAEVATQRYDGAQESAKRLRAELTALQDRAATGQQRVNDLRDELGVLAASQYREGAIDPTLALLLSDDPAQVLERAATLDRLGGRQTDRLRLLQEAQRTLRQQRDQAAGKLTDLQRAGQVLRARKRAVQRALASAQRLLDTLPAAQRAGYAPGMTDQRASRDRVEPDLPALPASSGRAAVAVAAARQMLGAPYVWGATGPNAFDCSGLMLYAYRRAGVALPRTSQEQMNAGAHIPLDQVRPGDLVIYRGDASHVAMYVGAGQVIHAPYPGARVRYDPIGMMPINSVTRP
ncbi:NlpC/P60 family protein [Streptomyces sp. V4-01]|uniref:NlpC/P60 family protein n=1 Tax=Actinacidiphila polyblastidii TaxID=3110430 RepID=A0ABU7P746_9ACTN|nr:NlpC/P60 family protein [Streptomyces sp. V4-01]